MFLNNVHLIDLDDLTVTYIGTNRYLIICIIYTIAHAQYDPSDKNK